MFDKLPRETLIAIVSQLDFADKLNLACTNRQWHCTICSLVLYQKLDFGNTKGDVNFPKLYRYFSDNPTFGGQTTVLNLNHHFYLDSLILHSLPCLFPNVRHLQLYSTMYTIMQPALDIVLYDFKRWRKLQTVDINEYKIAFLLLRSHDVFEHLTSLTMDMGRRDIDILYADSERLFKRVLTAERMPVLKRLCIHNAYIDIECMEHLHQNVPHLKKLHLVSVRLDSSDIVKLKPSRCGYRIIDLTKDQQKDYVKTAASSYLTYVDFEIENESVELTAELLTLWLIYCGQKYDNNAIEHFVFDLSFHFDQPRHQFPELQPYFIHTLSKMPRLKHFMTAFTEISPELLWAMDEHHIKLTQFSCYVNTAAGSTNCQKLVDICRNLSNCKQASSLTSMGIQWVAGNGTLSIQDTNRWALTTLSRALTHLTRLSIDSMSVDGSIWVTILQNPPPQLTDIGLGRINSVEKPTVAYRLRKITHSPIRHLALGFANFHVGVDNHRYLNRTFKVVFAACPNLHSLVITDDFHFFDVDNSRPPSMSPCKQLELDMINLKQLRKLRLRMGGVRYYMLPAHYQPLDQVVEPPVKQQQQSSASSSSSSTSSVSGSSNNLDVERNGSNSTHHYTRSSPSTTTIDAITKTNMMDSIENYQIEGASDNLWLDQRTRKREGSRNNNRPYILKLNWTGKPKITLQKVAPPSFDDDDDDYWIITPFLQAFTNFVTDIE